MEVSSWCQYSLNGVEDGDLSEGISGFPITLMNRYKKHQRLEISMGRMKIVVKIYKDMVNVDIVGGDEKEFGQSVGLMGNFLTGKRLARDGVTIIEDDIAFGQEWQVRDTEPVLFNAVRSPQYPQECILPEPKTHLRVMSREAAEKACSHHSDSDLKKNCIFDVMITGDLELAQQF